MSFRVKIYFFKNKNELQCIANERFMFTEVIQKAYK